MLNKNERYKLNKKSQFQTTAKLNLKNNLFTLNYYKVQQKNYY